MTIIFFDLDCFGESTIRLAMTGGGDSLGLDTSLRTSVSLSMTKNFAITIRAIRHRNDKSVRIANLTRLILP